MRLEVEELEPRCVLSTAATIPTMYECWTSLPDGSEVRKVWDQGWENVKKIAVVVSETTTPITPWIAPCDNDPGPYDTIYQKVQLIKVPNIGLESVLIDFVDTGNPADPSYVTHNILIHDPVFLTAEITTAEFVSFDTTWHAAWTTNQQQFTASSPDGETWTITQPTTTPVTQTTITTTTTPLIDDITFDPSKGILSGAL